jgi:hypothetical protein
MLLLSIILSPRGLAPPLVSRAPHAATAYKARAPCTASSIL